MPPTTDASDLIAQRIKNALDLQTSRMEIANNKIATLEETIKDHEARIRELTSTATQYKTLAALATGGGLLSLLSLAKLLLGTP